ncbi:unnamed protein product [Peronospora farinosa]|uniref:Uncharacterized protein n=1 Tax=Peronospora farinosa TaxID=134698 RepID=A0AAV0TMV2_9STRA|nr:unnamed protein product [Peronospora farinosa]CAI5722965.1 unnamed protein product [Peronospora farinosa]
MTNCFQRLQQHSTSLKLARKTTSSECQRPCSNLRQSRFGLVAKVKVVQNAFTFATKPVSKSVEILTKSRKRDRIRNYLVCRREVKTNEALLYVAEPAILSTDKEEIRSSDDTEEGDDVYMVDCQSDSDSDDDSCNEDDFVAPPVIIPEIYRKQDRLGGVIVAGARVLFTNAAFQRQQAIVHKLQSVPEGSQLAVLMGLHREPIVIRAF